MDIRDLPEDKPTWRSTTCPDCESLRAKLERVKGERDELRDWKHIADGLMAKTEKTKTPLSSSSKPSRGRLRN